MPGHTRPGLTPMGASPVQAQALPANYTVCWLGTDNGYIIKHPSIGADQIVYDTTYTPEVHNPYPPYAHHSYRSLQIEQLYVVIDDLDKLLAQAEDEYVIGSVYGAFNGMLYSLDRGATFHDNPSSGPPPLQTNMNSMGLPGKQTEEMIQDTDGTLWGYHRTGSTVFTNVMTQSLIAQHGNSYTNMFPVYVLDNNHIPFTSYIKGDYIWIIPESWILSPPTYSVLYRQHKVTGAVTSYSMTGVPISISQGLVVEMGGWASNLLVVYKNVTGAGFILVVDITDPDNPTWATYTNPFGVTEYILDMKPVDDSIIIALTESDANAATGNIWKSTDKGATWSKKVDHDPVLGLGIKPTTGQPDTGVSEDSNRIAISPEDPRVIFVGTKSPSLYKSLNKGDSWTIETIDTSIFSVGGGNLLPAHWLSVACIGRVGGHKLPFVTLIGAT